jgi:zinc protease
MRRRHRFPVAVITLAVLLACPAAAQVKDHLKLKYPPLPEFKIERPQVHVLDNGLTLFLLEDHELPLISVSARIRTGSDYEPADKVGLAGLMAAVQRTGGTGRMTGDAVDDYLASRAAVVETGMGGNSGSASMNCLKQDFDDVFQVLVDVLRTPRFDPDKLEVAKLQANDRIARRNDSVGAITSREFARLVYGPDSPLARLEEHATIAAVTRDDLLAFHRAYYHPNATYLGIVGDFDAAAMKAKVEAALRDWPRGPEFRAPEVAYRKEPNPGVYFVEKADVTQANIRMGHLGILVANPDYFAVEVMNELLGGSFASRLFSNVRSEKGLAYNVFGAVGSGYVQPGLFQLGMQTKSQTMTQAVAALRQEIDALLSAPPSASEVARAKASILESFVFNYTSKAGILSQQMTYAYYGLPSDFLERYRANVEKVTPDDVARVAKQYIHPDQLALLVVGKAADFDRPVDSLGKVTTLDITIPPPAGAAAAARTPQS